jgi:hypothetical protein
MGDLNQLIYAQAVFSGFRGRVLEVGSKDYGNTQPFRNLFPGCDYVGIDLEAGKNVDYVVNLENGLGPIAGQQFDVIIICSVLEHSPRPWVIAEHLQSVLSPEGALMSCHPWVQRYHKYPDDYFRFSPRGIMSMFTGLGYWLPVFFATSLDGEFVSFSEDENVDNGFASFDREGRKCLPYLQSMMTGTRSEKTYRQLHESFSRVAAPRQG